MDIPSALQFVSKYVQILTVTATICFKIRPNPNGNGYRPECIAFTKTSITSIAEEFPFLCL